MDLADFTPRDWINVGMAFAFLYFLIKSVIDWQRAELIQGKIVGYKYLRFPKKRIYGSYDKFLLVPLMEYSEPGHKSLVSELHETSLIKPEGTILKFHAIKKSQKLYAYHYSHFFAGLIGLLVWPILIVAAYDLHQLVGINEKLALTISLLFLPLILLARYYGDVRIYGIPNRWLLDFSRKRQDAYINKDGIWHDGQHISYAEVAQSMQKNKVKWRLESLLNFLAMTCFALLGVAFAIAAFMLYFDLTF